MIDAKDLRIGNWVLRLGNPTQINAVSKGYVSTHSSGSITENQIESIPLTPEILEKCGFSFKPIGEEAYEQFWILDGFTVWQHDKGFCHDYHHGGNIFYLHDLQNLYYALTKQELKYTP